MNLRVVLAGLASGKMAFITLIGGLSFGQRLDPRLLEGIRFRSIGPACMSGRVTALDALHANPALIYAGTASGGLWKTENGGSSWRPLLDTLRVLSVGAVAVQQNNPDVIWVGTGEGNPRNTQTSGAGIFKSLDGGKTWKCMGLEKSKAIHRLLIHRDNPDIIYACALGSAFGPGPERGVFRTTDGGATWKKILFVNDSTGCAELVVDPSNPDKLIAAMWEYGRKPWTFHSGGKGSGIYVTFDGGDTWQKRTDKDGLPKGELGRIGLAIARAKPSVVYALVESKNPALYRSDDGGFKWTKVADKNIGNRPFYYSEIYVDPKNENRLYNLYTFLSKSEDGGKTFQELLHWGKGVHPDHHALWIHPENPDFIIEGNDGGLSISRDRGESWQFAENLPLGQFYHINVDMDRPYHVYGGLQDNGSWRGPAYVWEHGGIRSSHWEELLFGDGFDVLPAPGNSRFGYAMYQGGNLYRYDILTGHNQFIQPVHPDGKPLRFNWNAALAQDLFDTCTIYFGSQFVHKSADCGRSWEIISPDLTTNDTAKQKQAQSGGLTIDATRAENFTTIVAIAPSPLQKGLIWAGTDDGNLQLTVDGGNTWKELSSNMKGAPRGAWIPHIEPSPHDPAVAFVTLDDHRRNNWNPYVFRTGDFGKTWKRIVNENQVYGHALCLIQDPAEPGLLFLGTEHGLYFSIDGGAQWNKWGKDFPSVAVTDMKIHPREYDLVVATFGRAVYVLDDIRPLRELARTAGKVMEQPLRLFEPTAGLLVEYKQAAGARFTADAAFKGANREYGAMFTFWVKDIREEKDSAQKEDAPEEKKFMKAKIIIFDESGDTVRNFSIRPDTGFNRFAWDLSRNGVRYPSYDDANPSDDPPPGPPVTPGRYKVRITYGELSDSVFAFVQADPRKPSLPVRESGAKEEFIRRHMEDVRIAVRAFDRMKEAQKTVDAVNGQTKSLADTLKKRVESEGKAAVDSLKKLMEIFLLPKDFRGYDHITMKLNDRLERAGEFIGTSEGTPSSNAFAELAQAEKELGNALEKINGFFEGHWKEYREFVQKASITPFADYERIEMKKW